MPTFVPSATAPRTRDGGLLDMRAGAYDTCVLLGHDSKYAEFPNLPLPAPIAEYYGPWGDEVLKYALIGWCRGRGFTMRDPWKAKEPVDKGRRGPRRARGKKEADAPAPVIGAQNRAGQVPLPVAQRMADDLRRRHERSATSAPKAPAYDGPDLRPTVRVEPDQVVLTKSVIAALDKDTRALLRSEMRESEYLDRTVAEVARHFRVRSHGMTPDPQGVMPRLRRELRFAKMSTTTPMVIR